MKKELLIPRKTILARVNELALQISSDYADREPTLIGILNGVIFFFTELVMKMTIPSRIDFLRAASYGSGLSSSGTVNCTKDVEIPLQGEPVIIIEDIVDTGLTLREVIKRIEDRNPESIKICALIDKPERRDGEIALDYCGFQIKEGFLVGYGLDHNEKYRYLQDIYVLK